MDDAQSIDPTSIDKVWQNVALEERLELIAKAQASGIMASLAATLLIGTIGIRF